jgi:hypothetical protein
MTGDTNSDLPVPPSERRRLKLHALSVSVDYADYLECVAPNIRHFDRWLVVTKEEDARTRDVCRRWGMEVLFSRRLHEGGAVFHKAAALNEGLETLDPDTWVAVMDSDILLPRDFRERLEAQALDPSCLYGLSGRRICRTFPEFRFLSACEPWADNLIYTTFVIGYFNLFYLGQKRNRYPDHGSKDASSYDVLFSESFPATNRRYLPFVCLHAGDRCQNWQGRVTDPFLDDLTLAHTPPPPCRTEEIAARLGGAGKTAVQIGCYDSVFSRTLASHFDRVLVIDHWGLTAGAASPELAIDLKFVASRYFRETAGHSALTTPLGHSDETLDAIADHSLDVIWLTCEPEYDFLLLFLPSWLPKLKPGGTIAGNFYEPQLLPGPSRVVQLLLGRPDEWFPDGQWLRRIGDPDRAARRLIPAAPAGAARGVIYVSTCEEDVEALLVSLNSLQRHWNGPVCVTCCGDESASLRLACVRLGVVFLNVPRVSELYPDESNRLHALEWSPFGETVFVDAATLFTGSPQFLFDALTTHTDAFCLSSGRGPGVIETCAFAWRRGSPVLEAWRSLASGISDTRRAVPAALAKLHENSRLHLLPAGAIWSGSAKRAPAGTRILALSRLFRAGALHLFRPWADEEQVLIARLARDD